MQGTSSFMGVALLSSLLTLGCGGEAEPSRSTPTMHERAPGSADPSLSDWLPEGHTELPGPIAQGALPPGHPPIGDTQAPGGSHPPTHPVEPAGPAPESVSGTVRETMDAAGYTYMRVETENGMLWVAGNQTTVAVGDHVQAAGSVMHGFRSNTLDRTFDRLVLASSVRVGPPAD